MLTIRSFAAATLAAAALTAGAAAGPEAGPAPATAQAAPGSSAHDRLARQNLRTFREYDFRVFNRQAWDRVGESHAQDVRVINPDGSELRGLDAQIADLRSFFVYAPDAQVARHVYAFGAKDRTAVRGIFEGTFTRPMPDGQGGTIPPTGNRFSVPVTTVARWRDGRIVEKYVSLDVQGFLRQLGLAG